MLVITILSICVLTILFYQFLSLFGFIWKAIKIPGPWAHFTLQFMGIVFKLAGKNEVERTKVLLFYANRYPKLAKVIFGHMFIIYLHDPDLIQKVYTSQQCLEKPFFYKFFGFGTGLITAKVKTWKPHRKILNNAFSLKALQSYLPIFCESSDQFVRELAPNIDGPVFDMLGYATKCTLDNICCTSFGVNVNAQEKKLNFNAFLQR